jgi:hypothetical protein
MIVTEAADDAEGLDVQPSLRHHDHGMRGAEGERSQALMAPITIPVLRNFPASAGCLADRIKLHDITHSPG